MKLRKKVKNNGGRTGYYDLPFKPCKRFKQPTINDLIEHQDMRFWQGEIFKASYAIKERSKRDTNANERRELNKIKYYTERRLAELDREEQ